MTNRFSLDSPIRINWNLGIPTLKSIDKIIDELLTGRILLLSVSGWEKLPVNVFIQLISLFNKTDTRLSLIHDINNKIELDSKFLKTGIESFIVEIDDINQLRTSNMFLYLKKVGADVAVSMKISTQNYKEIPDIFRFCSKNKIKKIIFPNITVVGKKIKDVNNQILSSAQKENLAELINSNNHLLKDIALDIYDPYLWKLINANTKETKMLFQGCQAANIVAFIDSVGDVYPCPSLPIKLGNLKQKSLKEIWASEKRLKIRGAIEQTPEECKTCSFVKECKGGCRGITYCLKGSFNFAEPSCWKNIKNC